QRRHCVKWGGIGGSVGPISRLGVQRRLQQANLVVVVERTDRKTRPPGQLSHLQGLKLHGDPPPAGALATGATTACYGLTLREGQGQGREKKVLSGVRCRAEVKSQCSEVTVAGRLLAPALPRLQFRHEQARPIFLGMGTRDTVPRGNSRDECFAPRYVAGALDGPVSHYCRRRDGGNVFCWSR